MCREQIKLHFIVPPMCGFTPLVERSSVKLRRQPETDGGGRARAFQYGASENLIVCVPSKSVSFSSFHRIFSESD
jgi:hypothetical protein